MTLAPRAIPVFCCGQAVAMQQAARALADASSDSGSGTLRPGRCSRIGRMSAASSSAAAVSEASTSWVVFEAAQLCIEACVWVQEVTGGLGGEVSEGMDSDGSTERKVGEDARDVAGAGKD